MWPLLRLALDGLRWFALDVKGRRIADAVAGGRGTARCEVAGDRLVMEVAVGLASPISRGGCRFGAAARGPVVHNPRDSAERGCERRSPWMRPRPRIARVAVAVAVAAPDRNCAFLRRRGWVARPRERLVWPRRRGH